MTDETCTENYAKRNINSAEEASQELYTETLYEIPDYPETLETFVKTLPERSVNQ